MADWGIQQNPDFAAAALGGYAAGQKVGRQKQLDAAMAGVDLTRPETLLPLLRADPSTGAALIGASVKLHAEDRAQQAQAALGSAVGDYFGGGSGGSGPSSPKAGSVYPEAPFTPTITASPTPANPIAATSSGPGYMGFNYAQPGAADTNESTWDKRGDGSAKGHGFLGLLQRPGGGVSSEISIGVDGSEIGSKQPEIEIPTMVPTLNKDELNALMTKPEEWVAQSQDPLAKSIKAKAADYARGRIAQGKSPFAQADESPTGQTGGDITVTAAKPAPVESPTLGHTVGKLLQSGVSLDDAKSFVGMVSQMNETQQKSLADQQEALGQVALSIPPGSTPQQAVQWVQAHKPLLLAHNVPEAKIDAFTGDPNEIRQVITTATGVKAAVDDIRADKAQTETANQHKIENGFSQQRIGIEGAHLSIDQQREAREAKKASGTTTAGIATPASADEYKALPAGARYYKNGQVFIKGGGQ